MNFTISSDTSLPASVYVASPNDGEIFRKGDLLEITWTSVGVSQVNVYIEHADGTRNLIAPNVSAQAKRYGIYINDSFLRNYKVTLGEKLKAVVAELKPDGTLGTQDVSDAPFTIVSPSAPTIIMLSPGIDQSDVWEIGRTYQILWMSYGLNAGDKLFIDLVKPSQTMGTGDFLEVVQRIAEVQSSDTTYYWTIPSNIPPADYYKIRVMRTGADVSDISDKFFEITTHRTVLPLYRGVYDDNGNLSKSFRVTVDSYPDKETPGPPAGFTEYYELLAIYREKGKTTDLYRIVSPEKFFKTDAYPKVAYLVLTDLLEKNKTYVVDFYLQEYPWGTYEYNKIFLGSEEFSTFPEDLVNISGGRG